MLHFFFYQLAEELTRDFILEGWLKKMGPRNEPFKKRFFTLDKRKLMYLEEPLVNVTCTQIYMYIWTHLSWRRIWPFTSPLLLSLFLATLVASVYDWNRRSCLSLLMVLLQASFGQRLFLLPPGVHDIAIFACLLLFILFQPFPPSWNILHL